MNKIISTLVITVFLTGFAFGDGTVSGPSLKFKSDPLITSAYTMANLKQVLSTLSQTAKINFLYDEGVQLNKMIPSFTIKDLPFSKTLDAIMATNGLEAVQLSEDTLIIVPSAKYQQYVKNDKRIFTINYLDAPKLLPTLQAMYTSTTAGAQQQGVKFIAEDKRNLIIAIGSKDTLDDIAKSIIELDQKVSQVVVELKILETSREKNTDIGSALNSYQLNSNQLTISNPYLGLTDSDFPSLIKFLQTNSDVKTLASPNIRVLDRQKAQISITDQVPLNISTTQISSNTTVGGGTPTAFTTTQVQFFDIGIKFTLTPTIHSDSEVTIDLLAEITSLGKVTAGNNIPEIGKRSAQTIIRLKDGETNILSGLNKQEERVTKTHLPILSDIPLLGFIFDFILGSTSTQTVDTEIVMSITPHIISAKN